MKMERIYSNAVSAPAPGLWSNCKRFGTQVFLSGLVALDVDGNLQGVDDPHAQAVLIFKNMRHYMEAAGGSIQDIIKVTIYVTDMSHRPSVLEARQEFFSGDFPCSTLVGVSELVDPRMLVEIDAVGFIGAGED